jgi:hypothetical protein
LAQIAQRNHGLGEVEGGRIVQADQLAQFRKPNALAVTRNFLEDRKGAAQRLHADALTVVGVIIDVASGRRQEPGDGGLARSGRLLIGLWFGTRSHASSLHATVAKLYQASRIHEQRRPLLARRAYHNIN